MPVAENWGTGLPPQPCLVTVTLLATSIIEKQTNNLIMATES